MADWPSQDSSEPLPLKVALMSLVASTPSSDHQRATAQVQNYPWRIFLFVGGCLAIPAVFLAGALWRELFFALAKCAAALALIVGVSIHQPRRAWPWWFLAGGLALQALSNGYAAITIVWPTPFPTAGFCDLASYCLISIALLQFVRLRTIERDVADWVDSVIVVMGLGALAWLFLIEPNRRASGLPIAAQVLFVAEAMLALFLLVIFLQLGLTTLQNTPAYRFLAMSLIIQALTISITSFAVLTGQLLQANWHGLTLWIAVLGWGAAALHPSMRTLTEPRPSRSSKLTPGRLLLITAIAILAPGALTIQTMRGLVLSVPIIAASSALLVLLTVTRIYGLLRQMTATLQQAEQATNRERILRHAAANLVTAPSRQAICAAVLHAAEDLLRPVAGAEIRIAAGTATALILEAGSGGQGADGPTAAMNLHKLASADQWILLTLKPMKFAQRDVPDLWTTWGLSATARYVVIVPILIQNEARGIVAVASPRQLSEEIDGILAALAAQAALALESATLSADLHRRQGEERFQALVQHATDAIIVADADWTIRYVSPSAERILGYSAEELQRLDIVDLVAPEDMQQILMAATHLQASAGVSSTIEIRAKHRNRSWRHLQIIGTNLLHDPTVEGIVINCRDITDRARIDEQLRHQAYHDPLTGLPNRALFLERLDQAVSQAAEDGRTIAVLFLDLDRFKVINDSLGHEAGDLLLIEAASRLRAAVRPSDLAARLGGDEFTVLLDPVGDPTEAALVAEQLSSSFELPFLVERRTIAFTASVGVAISVGGRDRAVDLLRYADIALYRAKGAGKAQYAIFDTSMSGAATERLHLEAGLRRALEQGEFRVEYQPKIDLHTTQIIGFEALIRWRHSDWGLVSPTKFVPLAEETGLIFPIGRWVIEEACRQAHEWHQQHPSIPPLTIAINLSGREFQQPHLAEEIATVLHSTGIDPRTVQLEITEGVIVGDLEAAINTMKELRRLGVQLAVDDFGTGYSSLSYLSRFPIDTLKIDKSFVDGLGPDGESTAIVQAILTLGHSLGLEVVAEGVETEAQLAHLRALGCDLVQGFLFAPPLTTEEVHQRLTTYKGAAIPTALVEAVA